jgi:pimeloyl-ACP methyl ester carboxylesterase
MAISVRSVSTPPVEVPLSVSDTGEGRPFLLLHGGAGLDSVAGFGARLAAEHPARVIAPVHPGFGGTPRPEQLDSARRLADLYRQLLADLDLTGVTVVGSSLGGWVAAELGLVAAERISGLVLVDAVGLYSVAHPPADYFGMTLDQVVDISYFDPDAHRIDVSGWSDEQRRVAGGNRAALEAYGTRAMADPTLAKRLADLTVPALVVWGEADGMVTPEYGRELAEAIPGAAFRVLPGAGHLPQLEVPDALLALIWKFAEAGLPR